jgi:hypothetical protein
MSELYSLEYISLREELAQNKQYIFERPLLIITAIGIAATQIKDSTFLAILPFVLIITLWTNLVLTVNRLWSSSRIAAYIGVVFEHADYAVDWIGWENSLRKHRIWMKEIGEDKLDILLKNYLNLSAIPDSMMFYTPLLKFHVIIISVAIILSGWVFLESPDKWNLLWFMLSFSATICFAYFCIRKYNIPRINSNIEEQRIIWLAVFGKLDHQNEVISTLGFEDR